MSFKKHIKGLDALEKKIGYSFRDKSILTKSLTHPSFDNNKFSNMERLEFLGDRVLGLVISEAIFLKLNSFNEGSLSRYHNYFVQRSTCVLVAKKINLNDFKDFILKDFLKKMPTKNFSFFYDTEISSQAINQDFFEDLKKLEPFGTGNPNPIFLIKHLRVIRSKILKNNHLSVILKSKSGRTINSILFNSTNTNLVKHLQNYKKTFNVMAKINENIWNNKKALQLYIQDLII